MHPGFPDLGSPPTGWTVSRAGAAIRLVPPGAYPDRARACMVVSPLVPVSHVMPDVETVIRQALSAEVLGTGMTVESESEMMDVQTTGALHGKRLVLSVRHKGATESQRRVYTMYRDTAWLYGLHYISDEETFDFFLPTYETAAESILAVPPPQPG